MTLTDVPSLAATELGLRGLAIQTEFLVGADRQRLTKVLEAADKAGCPVLVLIESTPQPLATTDKAQAEACVDRLQRVAQAAQWLGCGAFAFQVQSEDTDAHLALVAERLKPVSRKAERLDLNLCISPGPGLTSTSERVTELLKKIGGFRVGTLPDFATASAAKEPIQYLRRLVPYASTVMIPTSGAPDAAAKKPKGKKKDEAGEYDLAEYVGVLTAVGYEGPVSIDFRGAGDPLAALKAVRETLAAAIDSEQPTALDALGLDGLDDELEDDEEAEVEEDKD
jgi:sugar phosphate isomerase/epimerase